jgi:hypothetical protein
MWEDSPGGVSAIVDNAKILQTVIRCAHYMNDNDLSKLSTLLVLNIHCDDSFHTLDDNGNTFFHLICQSDGSDRFITENNNLLRLLANKLPTGLVTPNYHGRLPLHVAIENGKDWKFLESLIHLCPESVRTPLSGANTTGVSSSKQQLPLHTMLFQYCNGTCYSSDDILRMWNAYPESALMADPTTGLYPFQVAATMVPPSSTMKITENHNKKYNKPTPKDDTAEIDDVVVDGDDDEKILSTVYCLLHGSPELLKLFVSTE